MDEGHLVTAARYVEKNPVASVMVTSPEDYPWSSTQAHLMAQDDKLVKVELLFPIVWNGRVFLSLASEDEMNTFRKHERSGRPLGDDSFVDNIEEAWQRLPEL